MLNAGIIFLSLVMVIFTTLFIAVYTVYGTGDIKVYGDEYVNKYFQRDKIMDINIEISEADWNDILENAIEEEFRPAKVTVNGDAFEVVEIRAKGNSSLSSVYRSESGRYSFKLNFGGKGKSSGQTMAGLTQLNLNNCFSDPSYMREFLSYQIFEEMGVPVPAFSYAAVHVNGEYFGLYLAVESILEPYLERNFGDITGDLYKSVGNTLEYNGESPSDYTGLEVKSTLKEADWSKLTSMLDALNNDGEIEKYFDVDGALRYIAVSTALANFDSYLGNMGHNYYLYEQNGVFTILPWDLNMSFGGFSFGGDAASIYIDEPTQGLLDARPLIAELLSNEEYLETYHGYLEEIAVKYLSGGYLEAETARCKTLISDYVKTDPTAFYTYEQFEKSISGTIEGGAMGEENQEENQEETADYPQDANQDTNNDNEHQGYRMGGFRGFGGNVSGILELAEAMSASIQKQLSGELASTNDGNGMGGGMGRGGERNLEGDRFPARQRPDGNGERPARDEGVRQPGGVAQPEETEGAFEPPQGMMLPEGIDMAALEEFRQEVLAAGGLTDGLREKAVELGIPENMLEMQAAGALNGPAGGEGGRGGMMPGNIPQGEEAGGNHPMGMGMRSSQNHPIDKTSLTYFLVSGAVITAGIIMALFFKRRRYMKI